MALVARITPMFEEAATCLREHDRMVTIAGHTDGLDQPLLAKVSKVA